MTAPQPLDRIVHLASRNVSGELICASDSVEVHVYFQRGRVAWATDSARPLAFTRHLLETAQIDVEIFREILDSCRREKRPLGETLIAWGVATREEVRDALRHQIDLAMTLLRESGPLETLFLNRTSQFADYDAELTFAIDELLQRTPTERPPPRPSVPPRLREPSRLPTTAMRLRTSIDGVLWAETLDETMVVESVPDLTTLSRVAAPFVHGTLLDGAELVAVQLSARTLAGVALSPSESLWCLVAAGVTVGEIVAILSSFLPEGRATAIDAPTGGGEPRPLGTGDVRCLAAIADFVDRAPELHGAFITDPTGTDTLYGVRRPAIEEADVALVDRRARALAGRVLTGGSPSSADSDGLYRRSMTAERRFCLFAGEIAINDRPRFLWLLLDRSCSKGIGWAYLTSLGRELARGSRREAG